jgi:AGZA family xanthine/uracil permease-like MFS transporter
MLGIMSFIVGIIPEAVITPILLFVGIAIISQAFVESPQKHASAVAFSIIPAVGYLVLTQVDSLIDKLDLSPVILDSLEAERLILRAVGHGFILTAILWGGLLARLIDGKLRSASLYLFICAVCTLFGLIHSVTPSGEIYLPWRIDSHFVWQITLGYILVGAGLLAASYFFKRDSNDAIV